jgi:hypothetical protein
MGERAMRPFWIHQFAEYLIGIALVSQGLQDTEPLIPTLAGAVVVVNAAIVTGPLGAFRVIGRSLHRWLDVGVMAAIAVAALQPWVAVASAGRATMLVVLLPLGFLWFYTDWAERVRRKDRRAASTGPTGEQVGKTAGRLAGTAFTSARSAIKKRQQSS